MTITGTNQRRLENSVIAGKIVDDWYGEKSAFGAVLVTTDKGDYVVFAKPFELQKLHLGDEAVFHVSNFFNGGQVYHKMLSYEPAVIHYNKPSIFSDLTVMSQHVD